MRITLEPVGDLDALGLRWRVLEAEAESRFFLGWTFLGCLAAERFGRAQLLAVTQDGSDVALALVGTGAGRLWLNQTGAPEQDAVFIEHNGLLARPGLPQGQHAALRRLSGAGSLVLSGVGDATLGLAAQAGWLGQVQDRFAPCVRLDGLDGPYLRTLSANARSQIGRSIRLYGPELRLDRAATLEQALAWLEEMAALHQAAWTRRGKPGAFATAAMRRFHASLVARAWPRDEADLLRVAAGERVIGLLYMFVAAGRVMSYQSGFAYDPSRPREKPGLVCHALAIQHYADRGAACYDLLAGADRYKRTLAQAGEVMHWATLHRPWSAAGLAARARLAAATVRAMLPRPAAPGPAQRGPT